MDGQSMHSMLISMHRLIPQPPPSEPRREGSADGEEETVWFRFSLIVRLRERM